MYAHILGKASSASEYNIDGFTEYEQEMIPLADVWIIVIVSVLLSVLIAATIAIVCLCGWHKKCGNCKCCTKDLSESQKNLYGKKNSETVNSGSGDATSPSQMAAHHEPVHQSPLHQSPQHTMLHHMDPRSVPYHPGLNGHNVHHHPYMTHSNRERGRSAANRQYQPPIGPSDHNMQHRQPLPHRIQSRNVGDNQPDQPQLNGSTQTSFQNNQPDHMVISSFDRNGGNTSVSNNNRPSGSYTQVAVHGSIYRHNAGDSGSHKNGITNYNPAIPTTNGK